MVTCYSDNKKLIWNLYENSKIITKEHKNESVATRELFNVINISSHEEVIVTVLKFCIILG